MKRVILTFVILIIIFYLSQASANDIKPIAWWKFEKSDIKTVNQAFESVSLMIDTIRGNSKYVEGVSGTALKFDGFTSSIVRKAPEAPQIAESFTFEAWIAIAAYPWNWIPIVAQENTRSLNSNEDRICWPQDISLTSPKDGYYFGINGRGQLGLHLGVNGEWHVCQTKIRIPLKKWTHVSAFYDSEYGILLYINGKKSGELQLKGKPSFASDLDVLIGMNREKREPAYPVRPFATLACWYAFDGIIDEIKIYPAALNDRQIETAFRANQPTEEPGFAPRIMPSGPKGLTRFGAAYEHLKYYDEWDALWFIGPDADIVVSFDESPVRVIFWRGTRYSPVWIMENNIMMADQSIENFNNIDGCIEHMLDPRCRFSHVRLIENTDARVVVHWRYCPTSANGNHSQVDKITGWEDWVDEYHTFFPDGIGVRKVIQHSKGRWLWPEEVIALCHPGQKPEDVIELNAMTLVNLKGKSLTLSWAEKTAEVNDQKFFNTFGDQYDDKPVISMTNLKSRYKPFKIYEKDCRIRIFAHEHRKEISHFPWWNHWPVAQILSDGRYCQAADRASHFSLAWGTPPPHKGENNTYWWAILYGATNRPATELVLLAKSWLQPPKLELKCDGYSNQGYDHTQRSYVLINSKSNDPSVLTFQLNADRNSPICNLSLVIQNWGGKDASLFIDGKEIKSSKMFRLGFINKINTKHLIVWVEKTSIEPITFSIQPLDRSKKW